jgi:hypothetical protein
LAPRSVTNTGPPQAAVGDAVCMRGWGGASPEEADQVARLAETLADCSWRDRDGAVRPARTT